MDEVYNMSQAFNWFTHGYPILNYHYSDVLMLSNFYLFTVLIYKQFIQPLQMEVSPYLMKPLTRSWNLVCFLFSACGFLGIQQTWPYWSEITAVEAERQGPIYFWVFMYIFTKPLEIVDTLLLMLQGKDIRLIHWSHHNITIIYTWYIAQRFNSLALLFAIVNLGVHTIMYLYYFLVSFECLKKPARKISYLITIVQIAQFIICLVFTLYFQDRFDIVLFRVTLAMYFYYLILFVHLYRDRNMKKLN